MEHTYCYRIKELCVKLVIEISLEFIQFLEECTFNCYLLHASAVCHHQVDFTATYVEKNTAVAASLSYLIQRNS